MTKTSKRNKRKQSSKVQDKHHHKNGESVEHKEANLERNAVVNKDPTCQSVEHKVGEAILKLSVSRQDDVPLSQIHPSSIHQALQHELKKLWLAENEILEISINHHDPNVFDIRFKTARAATRLQSLGTIIHENIRLQVMEVFHLPNKSNVDQQRHHPSLDGTKSENEQPQISSFKEFDETPSSDSGSISSTQAVRRILEKEQHSIDKVTPNVIPFTETTTKDDDTKLSGKKSVPSNEEIIHSNGDSYGNLETEDIHGTRSTTSEERLQFTNGENKKQFKRGPVDRMDTKVPHVLVTSVEVTVDQVKRRPLTAYTLEQTNKFKPDTGSLVTSSDAISNFERNTKEMGQDVIVPPGPDQCRKLQISGILPDITDDQLELYFESTRCSGGGEVESIERESTESAIITFVESSAASSVLKRDHSIKGSEIILAPYVLPKKRISRKIVVTDISYGMEDEMLGMYFENRKKSGGGEIENVEYTDNTAVITFMEDETARRVLEKEQHKIGKVALNVIRFTEKATKDDNTNLSGKRSVAGSEEISHSNAETFDNFKTVEIHGEISTISDESLQNYLENKNRSGGGPVESMDMKSSPVLVTFEEAADAKRVCSKEVHKCFDIEFRIKQTKPKKTVQEDTRYILLCNLNPRSTEDSIKNYVENVCRQEIEEIVFNLDRTVARISLSEPPDWKRIEETLTKKARLRELDKSKVVFKPMPICNSAIITNLAETTTEDGILYKLEHPSIGGPDCVQSVDLKQHSKYAIVHFESPEVMSKILQKDITLDKSKWKLLPYNDSFLSDEIETLMSSATKDVKIKVEKEIMEYIQTLEKYQDFLTSISPQREILPRVDKDGTHFILVRETSQQPFSDFYNRFSKLVIKIDNCDFQKLHQGIETEIKKCQSSVQGCAIKRSNQDIIIAGQIQSVNHVRETLSQKLSELKEELIIKQEQKEPLDLPSDKIHLLQNSRSLEEIQQQYEVKLQIKNGGLLITGQESKIEKAKMSILMKLMNTVSRTMKISKGYCDLLKTKGGFDRACYFLNHCSLNVVLTLIQSQNELSITALSSEIVDRAISALQSSMQDKQIPLDEGRKELTQSSKGRAFLKELGTCYNLLVQQLDGSTSNLVIVGIDISEAEAQLHRFLDQNAVHRKFLTIKMGLIRFIFQYNINQLKAIERSLGDRLVTIEQSNGAILIKGSESGLAEALKEIRKVCSHVQRQTVISQRPGVRKLFQQDFIKDVLRSIGHEYSLVIINETEDIEAVIEEASSPIAHQVRDTSGQSKIVCSFKTKEGKTISVYQGDITKHTVDVIVNPANNRLRLGGGVAGAIFAAGGQSIQDECNDYIDQNSELIDGEVAVTGAGNIECNKIIHTVGPRWQEATTYIGQQELRHKRETAKKALVKAIENTLISAKQDRSVAIPAVSSGVFGFPKDLCAEILVRTAVDFCKNNPRCNLREIHFINNDTSTVEVFEREFKRKFESEAEFKTFEHAKGQIDSSKKEWWKDIEKEKQFVTKQLMSPSGGSENRTNGKIPSDNIDVTKSLSTPERIAVELVVGDLSKQKVDVIVNSASSDLNLSKNPCARTLRSAAGPTLQAECTKEVDADGPLSTWDFIKTKAGNLNCQYVYHAVCGNYDNAAGQSEQDLGAMVEKLLNKASQDKMKSIAFPALGTGTLGFPRDAVAQIMLDSVFKFSKSTPNTSLTKIHLVAFHSDVSTVTAFQKKFTNYNKSSSTSSDRVRRAAKKSSSSEDVSYGNKQEDDGYVSITLDFLSVELVNGDITKENTDAIVVIGNEGKHFGGAVGRAIVRKEGGKFEKRAQQGGRQIAGTTEFIKTDHIPAKYVAHFVPVSPDNPSFEDLIESTYQMLREADNGKLTSISIPAIGSGMLGLSPHKSASIILHSLAKLHLSTKKKKQSFLRKIRIVIFEEKMLEIFKEELMKIIDSPQDYLKNSVDENWFREWVKSVTKTVKSFFSAGPTNRMNSQVDTKGRPVSTKKKPETNAFCAVTFNIYSTEQRNIQQAKQRIEKMVEENITPISTKKPAFARLFEVQKDRIKEKARQSDVCITFANDGTITIVGFHADTSSIMDFCHEVVLERVEEESQIEKENLMVEIVQWVEVTKHNRKTDFDSETNMKIEEAYIRGEKSLKIDLEGDNGNGKYSCCLDLKEMKGKADDKTTFKLERVEKRSGQGITLPKNWLPMPTDAFEKEAPFHVVTLRPKSAEYRMVYQKVMASSQGMFSKIIEIGQIQNPQLYKSFIARKETMDKLKGSNEKELFHGTAETSCDHINHHGFNRSFAGKNGTALGCGVYFAVDSAYSSGYATRDASGYGHMYLAKVLTGEFTQGSPTYKTAPPKTGGSSTDAYDTVVDNVNSPRIFVTFFDNQCYPEYLIVFQ